ncbi:hypothetical protein [Verrucomicrobium spinosum]|uniref:hypothetical protein n=1 Tax=Verrucomicrobium spinosum TaxID=2736 RepID=UPI000A97D33E|nr:hypothetical protein [Verrucomicrobium spinosum]
MLATFARVMDGTPPPQAPQSPATEPPRTPVIRDPFGPDNGPAAAPPLLHTTVWQIDTPLDWMVKALALAPDQPAAWPTNSWAPPNRVRPRWWQ